MLALIISSLVVGSVLFVGICVAAFASVAFEPVLVPLDKERFEPSRGQIPVPQLLAPPAGRMSQVISA